MGIIGGPIIINCIASSEGRKEKSQFGVFEMGELRSFLSICTLHFLVSHCLTIRSLLIFGSQLCIIRANRSLVTNTVNVRFSHRRRVMCQERIAIVAIVLGHDASTQLRRNQGSGTRYLYARRVANGLSQNDPFPQSVELWFLDFIRATYLEIMYSTCFDQNWRTPRGGSNATPRGWIGLTVGESDVI